MVKKKKRGVSRADAEAAVRTLLRWAGDDPLREGLHETPGVERGKARFGFDETFGRSPRREQASEEAAAIRAGAPAT